MIGTNMRHNAVLKHFIFFLGLWLLVTACGGGNGIARRGGFRLFRWLKYEFGNARSYSTGSSQIKQKYHILGYEPSWLIYDSTYQKYPYEFLTDLVIGEYDVNPETGSARFDSSLQAFQKKQIVEYAIGGNSTINILLAVTSYGDYGKDPGFMSDVARTNLVKSLDGALGEIRTRMGDGSNERVGLVIDFQNVPKRHNKKFADFVTRVHQEFNNPEQDQRCLIYVVLPFKDTEKILGDTAVAKKLDRYSDLFVIRTHKFDNLHKEEKAGPMVPLYGVNGYNMDSSLFYYTRKIGYNPRKLIMEVPLYGRQWLLGGSLSGTRPLLPLNEIMNLAKAGVVEHDTSEYGAYYQIDQSLFWFEDSVTLDNKYKWVSKRGLGGVGMYGLGYAVGVDNVIDGSYWRTVETHFAQAPPRLFFPGIAFLLCFFGVGVIWSVAKYWEVRHALAEKKGKFWFYVALMIFMIIAIVVCILPLEVVPLGWKIVALIILILFPIGLKLKKVLKFVPK